MQRLYFGTHADPVELLAVEPLPEGPSPGASLAADRERLLHHPLIFRDKVLFSTVEQTYLGFVAGLHAFQPVITHVSHENRGVPLISPLIPVDWEHDDGKQEPVQIHLLMGLQRPPAAPDTHADQPLPKTAQSPMRQLGWIVAVFVVMTAFSLTIGFWWSQWAAVAVAIGLISGGITAGGLQSQVYGRIRVPEAHHPDDAVFQEAVQSLASRQIATSALPGEWTATAIPAGIVPGRDWSLEIGAVVVVVVTGILLRWPPPLG